MVAGYRFAQELARFLGRPAGGRGRRHNTRPGRSCQEVASRATSARQATNSGWRFSDSIREGQAFLHRLLTRADIDVVQNLQMVRQELDGGCQNGPITLAAKMRQDVCEVGLHPFARLVAGRLPTETPAVGRQSGSCRNELGRILQLLKIGRFSLGDTPRHRVGGQEDGRALPLVNR